MKEEKTKKIVKKHYSKIATGEMKRCSCGCDGTLDNKQISKAIGYTNEEMINKARKNAEHYGYKNVEFRFGDIEKLPVDDNSIDIIISNCVINLAPDKLKVFKEAYRVLKNTGKMFVSDIVLLKELTDEQKNDEELVAGCVGGALLKEEYLKIIEDASLNFQIISEDKEISKIQYSGIPLESLHIKAYKSGFF